MNLNRDTQAWPDSHDARQQLRHGGQWPRHKRRGRRRRRARTTTKETR